MEISLHEQVPSLLLSLATFFLASPARQHSACERMFTLLQNSTPAPGRGGSVPGVFESKHKTVVQFCLVDQSKFRTLNFHNIFHSGTLLSKVVLYVFYCLIMFTTNVEFFRKALVCVLTKIF